VLWESTALFKNEVPRALFLTDKGCDAIILGLEEGSLYVFLIVACTIEPCHLVSAATLNLELKNGIKH
jgi:hypothetical protein